MTANIGIQAVDARRGRWPLHSAAASRTVEATAAAARQPHALMAAAGFAVARLAMARWPHAKHIHIWAGPGNNGGDGLVAARHLHAAGRQVAVFFLGEPAQLPADAQLAYEQTLTAGVAISQGQAKCADEAELIIDALLGLGANRAPGGELAAAIAAINTAAPVPGVPVLSVDLPSGLQSDTGTALGGMAVHANATLALLTLKPGCHTASGRDYAGEVWLDTLGVDVGEPTAWLCHAQARQSRAHSSNKGRFGDVVVVGGASGMTGAAWLAARAALAAGAGRVYASPLAADGALFDPSRPELMGRRDFWLSDAAALAVPTVVCGCGGGQAVKDALPALLAHTQRLVLDADALNAIAVDDALASAVTARAASGRLTVLTPHPLEAARLLQSTASAVQADRLQAAAELAGRFQATVVLKGSGSVIAAPGDLARICATGNAALATAGTGDVLAGWLGGLWAQAPGAAPIELATTAATWHGAAADDWLAEGHHGPLLASDLIAQMARG